MLVHWQALKEAREANRKGVAPVINLSPSVREAPSHRQDSLLATVSALLPKKMQNNLEKVSSSNTLPRNGRYSCPAVPAKQIAPLSYLSMALGDHRQSTST